MKPLTYTAEREAQIFGYTYLTKHNMWEVQKEIDALRAEVKKKDEALVEGPDNEAWKSVIKYAYADGGDGARNINSITGHYLAMRQRLAQSEKIAKELAEALGKCVYAIDDDGRLSDARDIARAALAAYTEHKGQEGNTK